MGTPRLALNGQPLQIETRKATALLIYLAVTRRMHQRDEVAQMLWPDNSKTARASLRRAIWALRKQAGGDLLRVDHQTVSVNRDADLRLDTDEFWRLTGGDNGLRPESLLAEPETVVELQHAVDLYRADFLQGFTFGNTPIFDDWQYYEGSRLAVRLGQVLNILTDWYRNRGEYDVALGYAHRHLEMDPLFEPSHRLVMQLLALVGRRQDALAQYDVCRTMLQEEFQLEPDGETRELMEAISQGSYPPAQPNRTPVPYQAVQTTAIRAYPRSTAPMVGRNQELYALVQLLTTDNHRLVTVVGPGGIGKSRLVLEIAERAVSSSDRVGDRWTDVCFVALSGVEEPDQLPHVMAHALGIVLSPDTAGADAAIRQLGARLGETRLLLILDNFDQLTPAAGLVDLLLESTRHLQVLVTSQTRLRLSQEQIYYLHGLPYPSEDEEDVRVDVTGFAAVQLFVLCAKRAASDFALTPANTGDIIRICRHVDGLPLGIQLAAAWVSVLTPTEIAVEMEQSIDFLASPDINLPARHSSMRRMLDTTWQRLEPVERRAFVALAVFPADFTRAAAEQITGLTLAQLRHFRENALLMRPTRRRYELHEILRKYAGEKLAADPDYQAQLHTRYLQYYASLLERYSTALIGPRMPEAIRLVAAEQKHLDRAWSIAIAQVDWRALKQMCLGIYHYFDTRGLYQEADKLIGRALDKLPVPDSLPGAEDAAHLEMARSYALLQGVRGWFMVRRGIDRQSTVLLQQSVQTLRAVGTDFLLGYALLWLGVDRFVHEEYAPSEALFVEAIARFSAEDDMLGVGQGYARLASAQELQGRYDQAIETMQLSIAALKEIDSRRALGFALSSVGIFAIAQGDYIQAGEALAEGYQVSLEVEDQEGMLVALETIGQLRIAQGRFPEAIDCFSQVMASYQEMGAHTYIKRSLLFRAMAKRMQGEYDGALADVRTYQRIVSAGSTPMSEMLGNSEAGKLASARAHYADAEVYLRKALSYAETMVRKRDAADILHALGCTIGHDIHRLPETTDLLLEALALARIESCPPLMLEILTSLALLDLRSKYCLGLPPDAVLHMVSRHSAATASVRRQAARRLTMGNDPESAMEHSGFQAEDLPALVDRILAKRPHAAEEQIAPDDSQEGAG